MLEVVRHVNIGHDLVRPTTECLTGNRMIGSYFKSNPDQEALGRGALKLMQVASTDGPRSYSAVGAEWVSSSLPPGRPDADDSDGPQLQTQMDALNMRVTALVALQEGLLVRLAEQALDFLVDNHGGAFAEVARLLNLLAKEDVFLADAE